MPSRLFRAGVGIPGALAPRLGPAPVAALTSGAEVRAAGFVPSRAPGATTSPLPSGTPTSRLPSAPPTSPLPSGATRPTGFAGTRATSARRPAGAATRDERGGKERNRKPGHVEPSLLGENDARRRLTLGATARHHPRRLRSPEDIRSSELDPPVATSPPSERRGLARGYDPADRTTWGCRRRAWEPRRSTCSSPWRRTAALRSCRRSWRRPSRRRGTRRGRGRSTCR